MKKRILTVAALCVLAAPGAVTAQSFGVGARVGTLGAGLEAELGLTHHLAVQGGIGLMPLKPSTTINNIDFTLTLPKAWYNLGVDLYILGPVHIGGGMLFRSASPSMNATIVSGKSVTIGSQTYTSADVAKLHGVLSAKNAAPYVLLGFGRETSGVGLFLDLGAAFVGTPKVTLTATGNPTVINSSQFQTQLTNEETKIQNDAGTYLKIWPILSLGIKVGLGH